MRHSLFLPFILGLGLSLPLVSCHRSELPRPRSALLLTIDTWRLDHFDERHSPNLFAMATQGTVFQQAWSPIGLTSPAHATMMTGLEPWHHGMRGNNHHGFRLDERHVTLAELARAAGLQTAAFVSAFPAGPDGGLNRGFTVFDGPASGERNGQVAVDSAMAWLNGLPREDPFFLWVHLYEPHGPYTPPSRDLKAVNGQDRDRDRYGGEVHAADRIAEALLKEVRRRGDVILAVAADHGEVLDEEPCGWQHERSSGEGVLHVPLFFYGPGIAPGLRQDFATLADIAPTLLDYLGMETPGALDGRPLRWEGSRPVVYAESGLCEPNCSKGCNPPGLLGRDRMVRGHGWSLVDRPGRGIEGEGQMPDASTWKEHFAPLSILVALPQGAQDDLGRSLGYLE